MYSIQLPECLKTEWVILRSRWVKSNIVTIPNGMDIDIAFIAFLLATYKAESEFDINGSLYVKEL